jgi:hypothetical protein
VPLILVCCLTAVAAGTVVTPPSGDRTVNLIISPVENGRLAAVGLPEQIDLNRTDFQPSGGQVGGGVLSSTGEDAASALRAARAEAFGYIDALMAAQDEILAAELEDGRPSARDPLRREVLADPSRYRVEVPRFADPDGRAQKAARAALAGLLVALLIAAAWRALPGVGRRASAWGGRSGPFIADAAPFALGATLSAGIVVVSGEYARELYVASLAAAIAGTSFFACLAGGRPAIRSAIAVAICLAPLRGLILSGAGQIEMPEPLLFVNGVVPAIVAGAAAATAIAAGKDGLRLPRLLAATLLALAIVVVLGVLTQGVGPRLYLIGIAQYTVYPLLAIVAWRVLEHDDVRRFAWLLSWIAALVGVSVAAEAAGIVEFVQAADPDIVPELGASRYGGVTGSYLHASMFLGAAGVVLLGLLLDAGERSRAVLVAGLLATALLGIQLTYSRGGYAILAVGSILLLVASSGPQRRRMLAWGAVALTVALGAYGLSGSSVPTLVDRVTSAADVSGDPGNKDRFDAMGEMVDRFGAATVPEKLLGEGLAATGNARQLTDEVPEPAESYPLKLLVEVGLLGLLLLGAAYVGGAVQFVVVALRGDDAITRGAAAAGAGLTVQGLIYPTLETQVLALTWWMLLALALRSRETWLSHEWRGLEGARSDSRPSSRGRP